eukprot:m.244034 g.244034  ORF g.244034 m.244034 type:complete len:58 (-) comp15349_c0_seq1:541-714(-)
MAEDLVQDVSTTEVGEADSAEIHIIQAIQTHVEVPAIASLATTTTLVTLGKETNERL